MSAAEDRLAAQLDALLGGDRFRGVVVGLGLIDVAEREIERACTRWPEKAGLLWHSFGLIDPVAGVDVHEDLYRGYARELLERVATGADTREGTAAEVLVAMKSVTLATPITDVGLGLYARMWDVVGMPNVGLSREHYEALHGSRIDAAERDVRRKVANPARVLNVSGISCDGVHHGQSVACPFAVRVVS